MLFWWVRNSLRVLWMKLWGWGLIRPRRVLCWDKKMGTYEKWGWSKDEILMAFRTDPWCMMKSEEKIDTVMDYLVNKMGFETSVVAKNSLLISLSMEKRIILRCVVFEYCLKKGLVTGWVCLELVVCRL
ncbi:putative transcription regulator mTERF family [Helianthus annuus]|uniref:Transcription regulator mTERF family n=2 Tax=Helianthus annuus TaxID=4232 RepID=A0A9K3IBV9_HELAN|nr:putative transcription regulator mTERF family [Helianthus annuus]KAJ0537809.1 putative transcription regulator mTERF family [Helianthus annuus]KAJ0552394.1 putative transcription regulator mTERF family [Helianthus annuus]KAJ0721330.1 putative transcription regulator mTERF family [Helianthus annuus]KAJ0896511.1 putative transcription regulator mTERF family [Helianthus annuus]